MKSIFEYTNYRKYLEDFYSEKKETKGYTYRDFSRDAGMNSSSWLLHLIKGVKNLSNESARKVARTLSLKKKETEFFHLIVKFTQAKINDEKDVYYKKIIDFKKRMKIIRITEQQYEYYKKWYHPVIRSLVSKVDFRDDYSLLAKKLLPKISKYEAKKSVELLEKLGFIKKNKKGKWVQADSVLSTGNEVSSLNVVNYHKQVSRLAEGALDRASADKRDISSLTIGINEKDFKRIKSRIQKFRKEIINIVQNSSDSDRVYQLNFQLYPVSDWKEDEKHE